MSIQRRLAVSITLVLVFSLLVGFGLTYVHILSKVRTELQAALAVATYDALKSADDKDDRLEPARKLRQIVADFDGDRHLRAILTAPNGLVLAQSKWLPPDDPAPDWFVRLVSRPAPRRTLQLKQPLAAVGTLTLATDDRNEIAEAWSDMRLTLAIMGVFFALVLALAFATIRAALSPLRDICDALAQIGKGDYGARIGPEIAHELAPLRDGFNAMAARLEMMGHQNRALNEQIATLQEEERTGIARDLHDEIGPFLFGVGADAAMIRQFLVTHSIAEIGPRAEAIADAIRHMQRHLKDVLRRLAPSALLDLGLAGAIENLIAFWRLRRPEIAFDVKVTGEPLDAPLDAVAFRLVQEAISNAIRHGTPSTIDVWIEVEPNAATIVVENDGGRFADPAPRAGFGLTGMRNRVEAVGGTLSLRNRADGRGVIVSAQLPIAAPAPPRQQAEIV
jgi:two-component system sensor histidine kinase UhpB